MKIIIHIDSFVLLMNKQALLSIKFTVWLSLISILICQIIANMGTNQVQYIILTISSWTCKYKFRYEQDTFCGN